MKNSKVGSFLLSTVLLSSVAGATVVIVHDKQFSRQEASGRFQRSLR